MMQHLVFNLATCLTVSFVFWYVRPLIHELGHGLALCFTKFMLHKEYKESLDIKISITFREGRTASKLLAYLAYANDLHKDYKANKTCIYADYAEPMKHNFSLFRDILIIGFCFRPNKLNVGKYAAIPDVKSIKYRQLIRFNHIAGVLLEVINLLLLIYAVYTAYLQCRAVPLTNLTITIYTNTLLWFVELLRFTRQTDFQYFVDPDSFSTKILKSDSNFQQPFSHTKRQNNILTWAALIVISLCSYVFVTLIRHH